jgi:hypothetical protein
MVVVVVVEALVAPLLKIQEVLVAKEVLGR